jgi:hypothetical protein
MASVLRTGGATASAGIGISASCPSIKLSLRLVLWLFGKYQMLKPIGRKVR